MKNIFKFSLCLFLYAILIFGMPTAINWLATVCVGHSDLVWFIGKCGFTLFATCVVCLFLMEG